MRKRLGVRRKHRSAHRYRWLQTDNLLEQHGLRCDRSYTQEIRAARHKSRKMRSVSIFSLSMRLSSISPICGRPRVRRNARSSAIDTPIPMGAERQSLAFHLILRPGQNGTKKLVEKYGARLISVPYRYDAGAGSREKCLIERPGADRLGLRHRRKESRRRADRLNTALCDQMRNRGLAMRRRERSVDRGQLTGDPGLLHLVQQMRFVSFTPYNKLTGPYLAPLMVFGFDPNRRNDPLGNEAWRPPPRQRNWSGCPPVFRRNESESTRR